MAVDLFSGCGGASMGLIEAGIAVVAAVECDPDAAATYRSNVGDHVIERRIEDVAASDLPACSLIHASPPCQGFSYAGKRDRNDPRNVLWRETLRIIDGLRPEFVTLENVRGFLSMGEDKPLILAFRAIGYEVTPMLLNAADYGVPQTRKRVFFVANRLGLANPVPPATHDRPPRHLMFGLEPWVSVREALGIGGAMRDSHRGHSPGYDGDARPARTVTEHARSDHGFLTTGHFGGWSHEYGDDGPAWTLGERPHAWLLDEPSRALRPGAHGQPGFSPRHVAGYVPDVDSPSATIHTMDGGPVVTERARVAGYVPDLDAPSRTVKAGGNADARGHRGGGLPPSLPNVPLDKPAPTVLSGDKAGGGGYGEPTRHRLVNRYAQHGEGSGPDDPAPTVAADRGLTVRGRASGDGDGAGLDDPAPTVPASWSLDLVDPAVETRAYAGADGRTHTRPGNAAHLRRLTPEECAILQGFPAGMPVVGNQTSRYRQIGNAVPPAFTRALGLAIKEASSR